MRWMRREDTPQEKLHRCWRLIEMEAVSLNSKEGQNMVEVVNAYTSISTSRITTICDKNKSQFYILLYLIQLNRFIVPNENQYFQFVFQWKTLLM